MPRYSIHILIFLAGLICGGVLMALTGSANGPIELINSPSEHADVIVDVPTENAGKGTDVPRDVPVATTSESLSTTTSNSIPKFGEDELEIPESYREVIGPAVQHITFGERYRDFEAEPIDESWAQAMEYGINDFIAAHGPESGEVFEFVQCRSSNCVLAGYTHPGQEPTGASIIGELGRQPWWQGSQKASSTHRGGEDRMSFVVLMPRFDE